MYLLANFIINSTPLWDIYFNLPTQSKGVVSAKTSKTALQYQVSNLLRNGPQNSHISFEVTVECILRLHKTFSPIAKCAPLVPKYVDCRCLPMPSIIDRTIQYLRYYCIQYFCDPIIGKISICLIDQKRNKYLAISSFNSFFHYLVISSLKYISCFKTSQMLNLKG